jgi:cold-inducible RNA-binding protein
MATKTLFVGNLPWSVNDDNLEKIFEEFGKVHSARVITDRETGRSRGFGFVEVDADVADTCMREVNGMEIDSRPLRVNEANQRGT